MLRTLALFVMISGSLSAAEITTLTGKAYTGKLTGIADGNVNITTDAGPLAVPVKQMAAIDFGVKPVPLDKAKYDEIELIDGSLLRIVEMKIDGKVVEPKALEGPTGLAMPTYMIPLDTVFYWQRGAQDAKNREEWKKLLASRGKRDLFVIKEETGYSPVPGTILGGVNWTAIDFERESDGQKVSFKLARATGGLVFNQPPRGVIPPTLCKLADAFGNLLILQSLEMAADRVTAKTVSGALVTYTSLAAITRLDFTSGNVAYLSDLEPAVNAPPAVAGEPNWTFLKDRTPDGPGFRLANIAYTRGLWIAPDVALTYKLNGDYRELKATVGVDDSINIATSAVRLTIEADNKPVFSETISRKEKPRELTLDVKNVKQLKITVDGEGLFLGNQVNLAEARLQK